MYFCGALKYVFERISFKIIIMKQLRFISLFLAILSLAFSCKKEKAEEDLPGIYKKITVNWVKEYPAYSIPLDFKVKGNWCNQNLFVGNDGSIAIFFNCYENGITGSKNVLLKTDADGNTNFVKEYTLTVPEGEVKNCFLSGTSDGGYLLYYNSRENFTDYLSQMIKIDNIGNLVWEKRIDFWNYTQLCSILEYSNGEYYAFCIGDSMKNYMLRMNTAGDTINSKKLNSSYSTYNSTLNSSTGNIILTGSMLELDFYGGNETVVGQVMSIDTNTNIIWSLPQFADFSKVPITIIDSYLNPDNSIIVVGGYGDYLLTWQNLYAFVACVSESGTLLWTNYLSDIPRGGFDIVSSPSGGYLLLTNLQHQIALLNEDGNLERMESIEMLPNERIVSIKKSSNDYIVYFLSWNNTDEIVTPAIASIHIN